MSIVVIPAKPLHRAKARLSVVLDPAERRDLCLAMLTDVCAAATAAGQVWVVTSDEPVAAIARSFGAEARPDPTPAAGLNTSLEAVIPPDLEGVLVLSSDLPAVTPEDVAAVMGGNGVTVAVDRRGTGTNALWRSPPGAIPLAFGEASRERHERLAAERALGFRIVCRPGLALDLDLPEDLAVAREARVGPATRRVLSCLDLPAERRR